jgi:transcription initiation factor TFIID subunit 2
LKVAPPVPSAPVPPPAAENEENKANVSKANGIGQSSVGKRKANERQTLSEDDDILALAAPLKKKATPPAGPSTPALPKRNGSSVTLKVTLKDKKVDSVSARDPSSSSSADKPPQGKGKDKEDMHPAPPKPKKGQTSTLVNLKKCKDVMRTIQKLPDAAIFARPVDPVVDGCPT